MATATLSNTPTVIDNAESTSNWGGDTFSLEPDIKIQGSNSVSCAQTTNGNNDVYVSGSWDFSTDVTLRLWFNITYIGYLASSNKIQIFLYDGSNTAYYYITTLDNYSGGWAQAVVYTGRTPDSGTVNKSSITRIGMRFVTSSKPRNLTNAYFDAWTYGDGYTVTGGTSGDEISWKEIADADKNNAYGIVEEINGVYFLAGDIKIGNGSTTTYFKSGDIIVFKDLLISSSLYKITFQGSGCNVDINGGAWSAAGTQRYDVDASTSAPGSFSLQGVQISRSSGLSFASGQTIKNCVFDDCYQTDPSTSTFEGNTFSNSTDTGGALLWPSNDSNVKDLKFINCDYGVEYDSDSDSSTPTFNNLQFDDVSGNYDVNNTSGGAVTINLSNGSNANSYTGSSVTFAVSVSLTLTGLADNTEVTIVKRSDSTVLHHTENTSGGSDTYNYTSGAGTAVNILIMHIDYDPNLSSIYNYSLPSSNTTIPIKQIDDSIYNNP